MSTPTVQEGTVKGIPTNRPGPGFSLMAHGVYAPPEEQKQEMERRSCHVASFNTMHWYFNKRVLAFKAEMEKLDPKSKDVLPQCLQLVDEHLLTDGCSVDAAFKASFTSNPLTPLAAPVAGAVEVDVARALHLTPTSAALAQAPPLLDALVDALERAHPLPLLIACALLTALGSPPPARRVLG